MITGAGGSIGVHVVARFLRSTDWNIVAVDSFRHKGLTDRLAEHFSGHPGDDKRVQVITHDLTAPFSEITKTKIGHIDYIIHLASLSDVEASIHDPVPFIQNNVMLTTYLLEYAREVKPEAFILFSTDEVYGPTPDKQTQYDEWATLLPSNPYSASKACQEMIAISYWRTYGVPVVITNTMNNFAEMQSAAKYPVMVQKALMEDREITIHANEKGEFGSRSYIHSGNAAMALLFILQNCPPHLFDRGQVDRPDRYNISGDRQLDNLELALLIAKSMGKELRYKVIDSHSTRPGHDPHYGLTNTKLTNLGFIPPVDFETSLKNVIDWQVKNKEWLA